MDSLHAIVPRALTELLRHGPMSQGKLEMAWRAAVGDALSRVTRVRLRPDSVVEVVVTDARWRKEITRSSTMVLNRLKSLLGDEAICRLSVLGK